MYLQGTRLAQHPYDGALRVAPDDRVVHDDDALAAYHVAQRVEFEPDAQLPDGLGRLDEGAAHVGVLDESGAVGQARLGGVADGGGGAGLRYRDHDVGLDRVLARQLPADRPPGGVDVAPGDRGVRAGEADVFEEAALRFRAGEAAGGPPIPLHRAGIAP